MYVCMYVCMYVYTFYIVINIYIHHININLNKFENLLGDNAQYNSNKIINIFKGEDNDFSKAVCLNAAAGLIVSEKHSKFIDAYKRTREHIVSGKTFEHLKVIQNG